MLGNTTSGIKQQIERGIAILRNGGVVAYPTDTVYGLGAGINFPRAIERIYQIKSRLKSLPLPLLLADVSQLDELVEVVSPVARLLFEQFWPGALTLVLPGSGAVPNTVTAGGTTIAVRIPAHDVPVALIRGLGSPIIGTSANLSGQPSTLTAEDVYIQLGSKIDLTINGGTCPGGKESTIVDITGETVLLLREGAISRKELEQAGGKDLFKEGD